MTVVRNEKLRKWILIDISAVAPALQFSSPVKSIQINFYIVVLHAIDWFKASSKHEKAVAVSLSISFTSSVCIIKQFSSVLLFLLCLRLTSTNWTEEMTGRLFPRSTHLLCNRHRLKVIWRCLPARVNFKQITFWLDFVWNYITTFVLWLHLILKYIRDLRGPKTFGATSSECNCSLMLWPSDHIWFLIFIFVSLFLQQSSSGEAKLRMCVAVKRKIQLYYWKDREFHELQVLSLGNTEMKYWW